LDHGEHIERREMQSYSIEQLAIHVTGDVAINHYRIKATWAANDDSEVRTDVLRITHTWVRAHEYMANSRWHVGARK